MKNTISKSVLSNRLGRVLGVASLVLTFALSSGCSRTEDLKFDDTAGNRQLNLIEECEKTLLSAPAGWEVEYVTETENPFTIRMIFKEGKKVEMTSDFTSSPNESTYRFTLNNGPVLSFDTYGTLHQLSDPKFMTKDASIPGDGYKGEFEFRILEVTPDAITLEGNKYHKTFVLKKLQGGEQPLGDKVSAFYALLDSLNNRNNSEYFYQAMELNGVPLANLEFSSNFGDVASASHDKPLLYLVYPAEGGSRKVEHTVAQGDNPNQIVIDPAVTIDGKDYTVFNYDIKKGKYIAEGNDNLVLNMGANHPAVYFGSVKKLLGKYYTLGSVNDMSNYFISLIAYDIILKYFKGTWAGFQWYNNTPVTGGTLNSFTIVVRENGKVGWIDLGLKLEPVDESKGLYKMVRTGADSPRLKELLEDGKPMKNFVDIFTTDLDPDNMVNLITSDGGATMYIVSQMDSRFWIKFTKQE